MLFGSNEDVIENTARVVIQQFRMSTCGYGKTELNTTINGEI